MRSKTRLVVLLPCFLVVFYIFSWRSSWLHPAKKIVLLYTTWNLEQYWEDLEQDQLGKHLENVKCKNKECVITYDRDQLSQASAVVFHAQDMDSDQVYSPENLIDLRTCSNQVWVWVNQESPVNVQSKKQYNGLFNWTATYQRNSEIFLPYFYYRIVASKEIIQETTVSSDFISSKTKVAAWLVSHCGGLRELYVLELQKFINITVYGKCKHRYKLQGPPCVKGTKECTDELSKYKFYLSFENSICQDYVTEKYWENALMGNLVPIVMGANYDSVVAVPGSYIDVTKFSSIKALGRFINYLDTNNKEYVKYFDWKREYEVHQSKDLMCSICESLHDKTQHSIKVYNNLDSFWSQERSCSSTGTIELLKRQIEVSRRRIN